MLQYSFVTCSYRKMAVISKALFRVEHSFEDKIVYSFFKIVVSSLDS